jgi:5-methylcytosine-specific restriction endonuclease McrA
MADHLAGGGWISPARRAALYERDENKCAYCDSAEDLTLDHLVGGLGDIKENLVTSCRSCNSRRGGKSIGQWMRQLRRSRAASVRRHLRWVRRGGW